MSITSRLNYFTGFFTTAGDWTEEQSYHIEKRKLHNRRLHTPGIMTGERLEFALTAAGGMDVTLMPGAALDGEGNELNLTEPMTFTVNPALYSVPATVYIGVRYSESRTQMAQNMAIPQYSGFTRVTETVSVVLDAVKPDNRTVLEVGRVQLQAGAPAILNPADPMSPKANEIDRRYVLKAGAVGLSPDKLPWPFRERIIVLMMRLRKDFAALDLRFFVPSSGDVRHGILTVEMLARTDGLAEDALSGVLSTLAVISHDTGQEIAAKYPPVARVMEFDTYMKAVEALIHGVHNGDDAETLLTLMDALGIASRELAEMILELPVAYAGDDMTTTADDGNVLVTLDGSRSRAFGGRAVTRYHWRFSDIYSVPQADSGLDRTVLAAGENETVVLDAGASKAFGGKGIVRYHWNVKHES